MLGLYVYHHAWHKVFQLTTSTQQGIIQAIKSENVFQINNTSKFKQTAAIQVVSWKQSQPLLLDSVQSLSKLNNTLYCLLFHKE